MQQKNTDVLIIGSGAAGLSLALKLADKFSVCMIAKTDLKTGSTRYAQGGIAAVMDELNDDAQLHIADTISAGAGLCHEDVVDYCIKRAKNEIQWLIDQGTPFTPHESGTGYHLTREGGHSRRRVIHADDATGLALSNTLLNKVKHHPGITYYENYLAVDLIIHNKYQENATCQGIYVLNKQTSQVEIIQAAHTVLATGGASKVYLYTSNPDTSSGDGIAMAWRAGCHIANMEFNQFHPTCLYHPEAKSFLITEALRGEGAKLVLPGGEAFMHKFDPREELAPRDIVARAIDYEMKRTGSECVYLDISHREKSFITRHFPNIYEKCLQYHIDITTEAIPVVPAAHYTCGGVVTNLQGKTNINQLFAIGETASTGLHGANRMASNSLLECLVFAQSVANSILETPPEKRCEELIPNWDDSRVTGSQEQVIISHNWDELRRVMWDYVGIVRSDKRLNKALQRINLLKFEVDDYYRQYTINNDLVELRNLVQVAEIIIKSAMQRKESRGLHYTLDYPYQDDKAFKCDTILSSWPGNSH